MALLLLLHIRLSYIRMEIFLYKKNLIENCEKNYIQTCSKQKIANVHLRTSVTKQIPAPGREKLNPWDRGKMCQAGPRWRPHRQIAWHTERLLHHVRCTNSKHSPSSNANIYYMGIRLPEWSPCLKLVRGFHWKGALQFVQNCVYDHLHADLSIISAKSAGIISSLKRAAGTLIGGKWVPTLVSVSWWLREAMRQILVTTFLEKNWF